MTVKGVTVWRCGKGRVEATPVGVPGLLRLTVSPLSALLPGLSREAIYLGSVVFLVSLRTVRQKHSGGGNYPAYTWWLNHGRRRFWLFTRTPVEWDAFGRPSKDAFANGIRLFSRGVPPVAPQAITLTFSIVSL